MCDMSRKICPSQHKSYEEKKISWIGKIFCYACNAYTIFIIMKKKNVKKINDKLPLTFRSTGFPSLSQRIWTVAVSQYVLYNNK